MKKKYESPIMEVIKIENQNLLAGSSVSMTPENWTGGGTAGSNMFEVDGFNFMTGECTNPLMGGDLNQFLLP